jgi:DNA-binding transcriptional MerR regulator
LEKALPPIPAKRYFTIGEVGDLCGVKPHVLRYWEQEFTQLRPMKRRGNRRYYQHHEVLMIRRIRDLLYDQGFTISGARNKLQEIVQIDRDKRRNGEVRLEGVDDLEDLDDLDEVNVSLDDLSDLASLEDAYAFDQPASVLGAMSSQRVESIRRELIEIRDLLAA